jgi:hypothetical protein
MSGERAKSPELLLEQLALGELSPADEQALRKALPAEEIDQALARLRSDDQRFHAEHDGDAMVESIRQRTRTAAARASLEKKPRTGLAFALPSLAALACLLLWFSRGVPGGEQDVHAPVDTAPEETRIKGFAHIVLYRRAGEQAETLSDGARARRGDMLQVGYVAGDALYGVIVSLDGQRNVTLHFPDAESSSNKLASEGEQLLGHAYELDDAPRFERFFFVTSKRPIDTRRVLAAARTLAHTPELAPTHKLDLGPELSQNALTLVKE